MSTARQTKCVLLTLFLLACVLTPTNDSLAAEPQAPNHDQLSHKTVMQILEVRQGARAEQVATKENFYRYLTVYLIEPKFRNENNLKQARELGIAEPLDQIPYFRSWFNFMYEELEETKEIREQFTSLIAGDASVKEAPDVERWLDEAWPAMDAIRDAASSKHFYLEFDLEKTLMTEYGFARYVETEINELMKAFRARAMYALLSNNIDSAVADCIALDRILKLTFQLNHHEVIDDSSREASRNNVVLDHLLESGQLTNDHLKQISQQWATKHEGLPPAAIFDQWERYLLIDYFERLAAGQDQQKNEMIRNFTMGGPVDDKAVQGWDWTMGHKLMDTDLAIGHLNQRYDELVEVLTQAMDMPDGIEVLKQAEQTMRGRMRSMVIFMQAYQEQTIPAGMTTKQYSEHIVDGMLALLMHPNRVLDGPVDQASYEGEQSFSQTAIAIARYRQDRGEYPEQLKQLVPNYLADLPVDPFMNGQPIQYKIEAKADTVTITLKSVGMDAGDTHDDLASNLIFKK